MAVTSHVLTDEVAARMSELARKPPHPEYQKLKDEISGAIRAAEVRMSVTGKVDYDEIDRIVRMKRELDNICARLIMGAL